jgi:hypothetical protein
MIFHQFAAERMLMTYVTVCRTVGHESPYVKVDITSSYFLTVGDTLVTNQNRLFGATKIPGKRKEKELLETKRAIWGVILRVDTSKIRTRAPCKAFYISLITTFRSTTHLQ